MKEETMRGKTLTPKVGIAGALGATFIRESFALTQDEYAEAISEIYFSIDPELRQKYAEREKAHDRIRRIRKRK